MDSDDDSDLESNDEGGDTDNTMEAPTENDPSTPTSSPWKKMKLPATAISPLITHVKPSKFHVVERAIGASAEEIKSNPVFNGDMNCLCTQANTLIQEMYGNYKDM